MASNNGKYEEEMLLDVYRPELRDKLKPVELLPYLLSHINNADNLQIINVDERSGSAAATDVLIEKLQTCGRPGWYAAFLNALKSARCPYILKILEGHSEIPIENEHVFREWIKAHMPELQKIDALSLMPFLQMHNCISDMDAEQVTACAQQRGNKRAAILLVLGHLANKQEDWFPMFIHALNESRQQDISKIFDPSFAVQGSLSSMCYRTERVADLETGRKTHDEIDEQKKRNKLQASQEEHSFALSTQGEANGPSLMAANPQPSMDARMAGGDIMYFLNSREEDVMYPEHVKKVHFDDEGGRNKGKEMHDWDRRASMNKLSEDVTHVKTRAFSDFDNNVKKHGPRTAERGDYSLSSLQRNTQPSFPAGACSQSGGETFEFPDRSENSFHTSVSQLMEMIEGRLVKCKALPGQREQPEYGQCIQNLMHQLPAQNKKVQRECLTHLKNYHIGLMINAVCRTRDALTSIRDSMSLCDSKSEEINKWLHRHYQDKLSGLQSAGGQDDSPILCGLREFVPGKSNIVLLCSHRDVAKAMEMLMKQDTQFSYMNPYRMGLPAKPGEDASQHFRKGEIIIGTNEKGLDTSKCPYVIHIRPRSITCWQNTV